MRIPASVQRDVADAIRSVWGPLERYAHPSIVDLAARRLAHASEAVDDDDVPTLSQVEALIAAATEVDETPDAPSRTAIRIAPFAQRGSAVSARGTLFAATDRNYVTWASNGNVWIYVAGIQSGTLSPDQKPTLTTNDTGYLFRSTDFERLYRWSGSAWADAPGQEKRFQVAWFPASIHADAVPGTGWQLCDGTAGVTRSTPTGGTTTFTAPDLTTDNRFIRAVSGATGGTGGSATTHTHDVDVASTTSGAPSATVAVQAGAGTTVATDTHTHAVDPAAVTSAGPSGASGIDALPPFMNMRPYVRL